MLKVEDLRVGNHVYDDYSGIVEVININSQYCYVDYKKPTFKAVGRCEIQYIQPIPLTEEWLIKFGFEKDSEDIYQYNFFKASFIADNPMWFGQSGCCQDETIKENIQYVHQLQNLYFALTNEELICN